MLQTFFYFDCLFENRSGSKRKSLLLTKGQGAPHFLVVHLAPIADNRKDTEIQANWQCLFWGCKISLILEWQNLQWSGCTNVWKEFVSPE